MKDLSKITNVLLFKDGFYWLTLNKRIREGLCDCGIETELHWHHSSVEEEFYQIVPDNWELKNGFEFASDAYSYITHLQEKEEV